MDIQVHNGIQVKMDALMIKNATGKPVCFRYLGYTVYKSFESWTFNLFVCFNAKHLMRFCLIVE